jgi:CheY-like chemotaxis protein
MKTKKILYVEDDHASLKLMEHMLRRYYEIESTANAEEALQWVQSKRYDLILMDIKLGPIGMTGLDLVREIRKDDSYVNVPIIAVTAYAMAGDREKLLQKGCNDYVSKPIDFKLLMEAIQRQLPADVRQNEPAI